MRIRAILIAAVAMLSVLAKADESSSPQIQTCFTSKGMDPATSLSVALEIVEALESMDVVIMLPKEGLDIKPECCETMTCFKDAAIRHGVVGVVNFKFLQFGPIAKITVKTFDTQTGVKLHEATENLKARDLPALGKLQIVLKEIVESLRSLGPEEPEEKIVKEKEESGFGYLVARTTPVCRVFLDGENTNRLTPIVDAHPLKVPAGKHVVSFETYDNQRHSYQVVIEPDKTTQLSHKFEEEPPDAEEVPEPPAFTESEPEPEPEPVQRKIEPVIKKKTWPAPIGAIPITLWSVGGTTLITGIVFGVLAKEHEDNANNPNFIGGQVEIEKAESDALVANIAFGVSAACIAAGLLIWLLDEEDAAERAAIVPVVTPEVTGVTLVIEY